MSFSEIKHFVRRELGCACPDQVFDSIDVLDAPPRFPGLPGDYLIAIGHRLLILVIGTRSWQEVAPCLEQLFSRGRDIRDAEGFGRFRLVVVTGDIEVARPALAKLFDALTETDDRVYLHVIAPEGLPALDAGSGQ